MASNTPASAQGLSAAGEGLPSGRFILYPSVSLEYTDDSNVLYRSGDFPGTGVISSGVMAIRPRILVDLPLGESRIRWAYSPIYRDYTSSQLTLPQHLSHDLYLEGLYKTAGALTLRIRDHFMRDVIQVQAVDPGGELTFGLEPFTVHEPQVQADLALGARQGLSVLPGYSSVHFDHESDAVFFDYETKSVEGRYNYKLDEPTTLFAFHRFEDFHQQRAQVYFGQLDFTGRTTGLALSRTLNQAIVASFSAGYEELRFQGGAGKDYSGPVLNVDTTWQLNEITRFELNLRRQPFQSFFVNNNYYLNSLAGFRMVQQVGRRAFYEIRGSYEDNAYSSPLDIRVTPSTPPGLDANNDGNIDAFESFLPSQGTQRHDKLFKAGAGFGFQFLRTLRGFLGYNFERRRSNINEMISSTAGAVDPFSYSVSRVILRIEAGWM